MLLKLLRDTPVDPARVWAPGLDRDMAAVAVALRADDIRTLRQHTLALRDRARLLVQPQDAARCWLVLGHALLILDAGGASHVLTEAHRRCAEQLPDLLPEATDLLRLSGEQVPNAGSSVLTWAADLRHASSASLATQITYAVRAAATAEPALKPLYARWLRLAALHHGIVLEGALTPQPVLFDTQGASVTVPGHAPAAFARSRRRFDFLYTIATQPCLSREDLFERVWGQRWLGDSSKNALHATVSRVRAAVPGLELQTNPTRGYRIRGDVCVLRIGPAPRPPRLEDAAFIGRQAELTALEGQLRTHPIVCLWGAPGVGKSRLASEVARKWNGRTLEIDLQGEPDAASCLRRIARRLGCERVRISDALRHEANTLLVLHDPDSVEDPAVLGDQVARWTEGAGLHVLSTQRRRSERFPNSKVEPLPHPDAIELLTNLAPATDPSQRASIARALDGLPLALVLAGHQLRDLPAPLALTVVPNLLTQVDGPLAQTITSSLQALPASLRRALARFAVISASLPQIAAQRLVPEETLQRLVRRGMLQHRDQRFSMLHALQAVLAIDLEDSERDLVLDRLLTWAEQVPTEHFTHDLDAVLEVQQRASLTHNDRSERLALQLSWRLQGFSPPDEVTAMIEQAIAQGGRSQALDLALAVARFSESRFAEGSELLPSTDIDDPLHSQTAALLTAKLARVTDAVDVEQALDHAVATCTGDLLREALCIRGFHHLVVGRPARGRDDFEASVRAAAGLGPVPLERARANLGLPLAVEGRLREAEQVFTTAIDALSALGVVRILRHSLHNLGLILHRLGDLERAEAMAQRALELHEQLGNGPRASSTRLGLAIIALDRGDLERGLRLAYRTVEETEHSRRMLKTRKQAIGVATCAHLHLDQVGAAAALTSTSTDPSVGAAILAHWQRRDEHALATLDAMSDDIGLKGTGVHSPAMLDAIRAVFEHARGGDPIPYLQQARANQNAEDHTVGWSLRAAAARVGLDNDMPPHPPSHVARLLLRVP